MDEVEHLTQRERQVLALVAQGLSNVAIGDRLVLTEKTVEGVITVIYHKLNIQRDAEFNSRVVAARIWLDSDEWSL